MSNTETNLECTVDEVQLQRITKEIGNIAYKAPTILKNAANATGKKAMKRITEGIEKGYTIKSDVLKLKESIRRKSATYAHPESTISSDSYMMKLIDGVVIPRRISKMGTRPKTYYGRVLKSASPKKLIREGQKAFIAKMKKSGHIGVFVRVPGETYKDNDKKMKIEELYSPAVPFMTGKMYRKDEDDYIIDLRRNVKKYVDKFLEGREKYDT